MIQSKNVNIFRGSRNKAKENYILDIKKMKR